jgi:hexokinase
MCKMPDKMQTIENRYWKQLSRDFSIGPARIEKFIRQMHAQMDSGLVGKKSSLEMLPAFVDMPSGNERGKFISLDLGGTNFRLLELQLKGSGRIEKLKEKRFALQDKYIKGKGEELFDFLAGCIKKFLAGEKLSGNQKRAIGFTFSFPVRQHSIASGTLLYWTKGFSAPGAAGKDVVEMLNDALAQKGLYNISVAALVNDTVGTLVTRAYQDHSCDIGVILGTGTNACYREKLSRIAKWRGPAIKSGYMLVNTEWGNFDKVSFTAYDRVLDEDSENPGRHFLEKMISGMYLGELSRLIMLDMARQGILFGGKIPQALKTKRSFKTEHMSCVAADRSSGLTTSAALLRKLGVRASSCADRALIKEICGLVAGRAAILSAAALAALILKIDPRLARKHTVAIDGTVYEKYPGFAQKIRAGLGQILGSKADKIKITLTKDGSGIGAGIIAAVAQEGDYA